MLNCQVVICAYIVFAAYFPDGLFSFLVALIYYPVFAKYNRKRPSHNSLLMLMTIFLSVVSVCSAASASVLELVLTRCWSVYDLHLHPV